MRVLINYKYTDKKLKLTQKVKITDTFFNLPFVLYLTLYSVDTFLSLLYHYCYYYYYYYYYYHYHYHYHYHYYYYYQET